MAPTLAALWIICGTIAMACASIMADNAGWLDAITGSRPMRWFAPAWQFVYHWTGAEKADRVLARRGLPAPNESLAAAAAASIRCADISTVGLAIASGGCPHPDAEPVETGGETVAWLCPECLTQLPAEWKTRTGQED